MAEPTKVRERSSRNRERAFVPSRPSLCFARTLSRSRASSSSRASPRAYRALRLRRWWVRQASRKKKFYYTRVVFIIAHTRRGGGRSRRRHPLAGATASVIPASGAVTRSLLRHTATFGCVCVVRWGADLDIFLVVSSTNIQLQ